MSRAGYDLVLPSNDVETLALSFSRDRIPCTIPYPPHDLVLKAFDKLELTKLAERAGVAAPVTVPATEQELARHTLPVFVKSRLHWYPGTQGVPHVWQTTICSSRQEAHHRIDEIREGGGDPLLQELILGRITHYHMVTGTSGHSIACVAQISEPDVSPPYTYPPVVGTRVRSTSVRSDERLRACLESILRDIQWIGFASFQFMLPHQGDPMLVGFNGRIPASFQQSIAASSNLPHLWASIALGKPIPTKPHTREGVRYQWLETWAEPSRNAAVESSTTSSIASRMPVGHSMASGRLTIRGRWSTTGPSSLAAASDVS